MRPASWGRHYGAIPAAGKQMCQKKSATDLHPPFSDPPQPADSCLSTHFFFLLFFLVFFFLLFFELELLLEDQAALGGAT